MPEFGSNILREVFGKKRKKKKCRSIGKGKRKPNKIVFYFRLGVGLLNPHIVNHGQKDIP